MRSNKVLPGRVNGQQCGGKVCYINRSVALKAMKSARKQRGDRRYHRERRVYKCHFWHVTSLTFGEKKGFRSQSQDRREAIEDIENTLSGSIPVDEAFKVLERMNEDRLAGREMRGVSSYVDEVEEEEEAGETEENEESNGGATNAIDGNPRGINKEPARCAKKKTVSRSQGISEESASRCAKNTTDSHPQGIHDESVHT